MAIIGTVSGIMAHINNVVVCDGSEYSISATTFPTYFLKSLSDASDTQMTLDIDLYRRHIAPALDATVRFVGTEPDDPLTRRYNELMKSMLPDVREVARRYRGYEEQHPGAEWLHPSDL